MRTLFSHALRLVWGRSSRASTAVSLALLATATAAVVVSIAFVETFLLRPLPFPAANRLVDVTVSTIVQRANRTLGRAPTYALYDLMRQSKSIDAAGAFAGTFPIWQKRQPVRRVIAIATSSSMMSLLGAQPQLGRWFRSNEDEPGAERVAVVSDAFWRRELGADSSVLDRTLTLDGRIYQIVGVMPPAFRIPNSVSEFDKSEAEVWISLGSYLDMVRAYSAQFHAAYSPTVSILARRREGVSVSSLAASLDILVQRVASLAPSDPAERSTLVSQVIPLRDRISGGIREPILLVSAGVLLVLLVTCANVSGLLLAKAIARTEELTLRSALGASRSRLALQTIIEGSMLALISGALGILVGAWALPVIVRLYGPGLPDVGAIKIRPFVVVLALVGMSVVGITVSLGPLFRLRLIDAARLGSSALRRGSQTQRGLVSLVVLETALTLMLLTTATLLLATLRTATTQRGYDPNAVIASPVVFSEAYGTAAHQKQYIRAALAQLRRIPGVTDVSAGSGVPVISGPSEAVRSTPTGPAHQIGVWSTTNAFIRLLRIPSISGQLPRNGLSSSEVALDATAARDLFGTINVLGRTVTIGDSNQAATVVAVVGDINDYYVGGWTGPAKRTTEPHLYASLLASNETFGRVTFLVRTSTPEQSVLAEVRAALASVDPELPIDPPEAMTQLIADGLGRQRFVSVLAALFAGIGVAIAATGIFALTAYRAALRTKEMGIRLALGARPSQLVRLVAVDGVLLSVVGVLCGIPLALGASRLASGFIVGVSPNDPRILVMTAFALVGAAAVASGFAALRVGRADPMNALQANM